MDGRIFNVPNEPSTRWVLRMLWKYSCPTNYLLRSIRWMHTKFVLTHHNSNRLYADESHPFRPDTYCFLASSLDTFRHASRPPLTLKVFTLHCSHFQTEIGTLSISSWISSTTLPRYRLPSFRWWNEHRLLAIVVDTLCWSCFEPDITLKWCDRT